MNSNATAVTTRRRRRSTEEIVGRIKDAALEEFQTKSYLGATTQEIAKRAGVAEALLFSHFGSKAGLFESVIFDPLNNHLDEYVRKNLVDLDLPGPSKVRSREYNADFHEFFTEHADTILCLVFNEVYKANNAEGMKGVSGLRDYFTKMADIYQRKLGKPAKIDPRLVTRISFAAHLSSVLFKDWLFDGEDFSEAEISAAIVDFIQEGLGANAAG